MAKAKKKTIVATKKTTKISNKSHQPHKNAKTNKSTTIGNNKIDYQVKHF
jgi:hypothetical protein